MPTSGLSILQLFTGSVPGGVLRYVVDLSVALRQRGVEVVLAGERGDWHDLVELAKLRWVEIPLNHGFAGLWRSARIIARDNAAGRLSLIHAHHRRATLVGRLVQRRLARTRPAPPLLYTLHAMNMPMGGLWGLLSSFGDHAHVASARARDWLLATGKLSPQQITVIPHGVDPVQFPISPAAQRPSHRAAMGLDPLRPAAAFVGRFEDPKNEHWIVDLAAQSAGALPDWQFILAGSGPREKDLLQRIASRGLGQRVHVLGRRRAMSVYSAADALLVPSRHEGFSLVCLEAMSAGLPVLRTRTGGADEMIVEGVTGHSCPVDEDAFITAATAFLSDQARLEKMGLAAASHVRRHLTFERQVEQTLELYSRLIQVAVQG